MKVLGTLIAAAAGLLLLSGTLAGESAVHGEHPVVVANADMSELPSWHPPVAGWSRQGGEPSRALPEGHPPIPACPVTGAVGKPGEAPRLRRTPVEGLVRI